MIMTLPNLEVTQTQKVSGKLTLGYVARNTIQFTTPETAAFLKYLNPPYGLKRDEMAETDCLTASVYVTEPAQRAFFDRMDEAVAIECRRHFKREPEAIIKNDLLKFKVPISTPVVCNKGNPLSIDDLKTGQRLCPILKATCIWSGGGSVGVSLKAVKIMVAKEAEPIAKEDEDVEFCFGY